MPLNRRLIATALVVLGAASFWLLRSDRASEEPRAELPTRGPPRPPLEAVAAPPLSPSAISGTPTIASAVTTPPPPAKSEDEAQLEQTRRASEGNPALALELARDGRQRYPASPHDDERARIVVRALAQQGRLSEARGEAETMVNRYPDSPWSREVEQHTGAHPRRTR
jgi:hypothetical protein